MTPNILVPTRVETEELLDHDVPVAEMERSLRDLHRLNLLARASRTYRILIRALAPHGNVSILDLGTGSSDILEGFDPRPVKIGLDFKIQHLLFGRRLKPDSGILRVTADAFRLPFRSQSVDLVGSSHFFHHFSPEENASILAEALRVARIGVFVTDTRRHLFPLAAMQLLGAARLISSVTRHDAPASVRQGYTVPELLEVASRVPAARFEVASFFPFRFGLLLWK